MLKPPIFGKTVAADVRRTEFDVKNEQLLSANKKLDLLFIGDSITQQWELRAYFDGFVVNRGIGGDTSEYLLRRFEADALQLRPGKIVLLIGVNDLFTVNYDYWNRRAGCDRDETVGAVLRHIRAAADMADNLVLCTLSPVTLMPPHDQMLWDGMVAEVNEGIKAVCKDMRLPCADYHQGFRGGLRDLAAAFAADGIHPNARGYAIMAETLKGVL